MTAPSNHRAVAERQRRFARSLRREMTDAEHALWRLLRDRRLGDRKFRRQVPFGPFIVDFVCFERKLVIEVDGGQHADSGRDARRDEYLVRQGFSVVRYWNNEVLNNREGVLTDLAGRLGLGWNEASPGSSPPHSASAPPGRDGTRK